MLNCAQGSAFVFFIPAVQAATPTRAVRSARGFGGSSPRIVLRRRAILSRAAKPSDDLDCGCDAGENAEANLAAERPIIAPPSVLIQYCTGCRWMMRAAWTAQELLTTFEREFKGGQVSLSPADPEVLGNGAFIVSLNGEQIFSRKEEGRFPELKELKGLVRDRLVPDRSLGHSEPGGRKDQPSGS